MLERYLGAFGPASKRDVAAWAGVAQLDFAAAWERLDTVTYLNEKGVELHDLPGAPLPPADTPLPPRLLSHWDQPLLAYADRERMMAPEIQELQLTLSGDPTVTVDGRVAATWAWERDGDVAQLRVTPLVDLSRAARKAIREEALGTLRMCEPDARKHEVTGL